MIESKRNQMGNATNPYQGEAVKALCVCSAGLLRSPTIAKYLTGKGYNTRACGTAEDYALVPISEALIHWCDEIHVVREQEAEVQRCIKQFEGAYLPEDTYLTKPIYVLDIPDEHGTFSPELELMIEEFYKNLEE